MNHTHTIVVLVLLATLLLIGVLQSSRFLAPLINVGVVLGLALGVTATVLATHLV